MRDPPVASVQGRPAPWISILIPRTARRGCLSAISRRFCNKKGNNHVATFVAPCLPTTPARVCLWRHDLLCAAWRLEYVMCGGAKRHHRDCDGECGGRLPARGGYPRAPGWHL